MKNTVAGVDLAKEVIQVCLCTNNKVHSNIEMV
jgi:transposase